MPNLNQIIDIRKDITFGGAVQTDWFYEEKSEIVAKNFVFHGPDFFGVTNDDVEFKDHRLMDTCSFAEMISNKLYSDHGNPIIMTIAGYGTGKSHLAVTLGKYFENNDTSLVKQIYINLRKADYQLAEIIHERQKNKNIVLILNGMRDFNLNLEILSCAKKVLNSHGYTDEFFSDFTKAYTIALTFINRNYNTFEKQFLNHAREVNLIGSDLKGYLIENIYTDRCFDIINEVYNEITGTYIRWDDGISAGEVLKKLNDKLCGENGEFNKILILFDEFGRYIEFASDRPALAGDSALQQIFEAIQDSNNQIIFSGFIQSDLKTYLSRVKKSSNISRYVGRYESGDKIYLSSNLETIFANLIYTKDKDKYNEYIEAYFNENDRLEKNKIKFNNLNKWVIGITKRGIWSDWTKYSSVVLKGIYPFDSITTMIITSLSDWYQQRSALNFLMKAFPKVENKEISRLGEIPIVMAIDIIKSDFFEELILAEKEGRQKSENCMLYEKILVKHDGKLEKNEIDVLAALLIYKLGKFRTKTKDEIILALSYFSYKEESNISAVLKELEYSYGIVGYDERKNTYDFIEDATGINDFNRFLRKEKNDIGEPDVELLISTDIKERLGLLTPLESSFGKKNNIRTNEWKFEQDIITAKSFTNIYIENMISEFNHRTTTDKAKGKYIYIYFSYDDKVSELVFKFKKYKLNNYPFIFMILDDSEKELYNILLNIRITSKFSEEDNMKYYRFISKFIFENGEDLVVTMTELQSRKEFVLGEGIVNINKRISMICNEKFESLYTNIISFPFDGFSNKKQIAAKKILCSIARSVSAGIFDYQWVQTQSMDIKNRIDIVLKNKVVGWGVVNDRWKFTRPTNSKVLRIFDELDNDFIENEEIHIKEKYDKYTSIPYGLNDYSFALLVNCYVALKGIEGRMISAGKFVKNTEWTNEVFGEKGINIITLKKLKYVKVNIEGYQKKYQILCQKIELNRDVSFCKNFRSELDELLNESDYPELFKEKIEACDMFLNQGMKLNDKRERLIGNIKHELSSGCTEIDFKKILKVTVQVEELLDEEFIEDTLFEYSHSDREIFKAIVKDGKFFIEKNYGEYASNLSCSSISQVGSFKHWLKLMEENLVKLKFNKFAATTKERRHKVTDNLDEIRKQQRVKENIDDFITSVKITNYSSQSDLFEWYKKAKELKKNLIDNKSLNKDIKNKIYIPLAKTIGAIDKKLEEIKKEISAIYDIVFELRDFKEIISLKGKIEYTLDKKLRKEDKDDIFAIGSIITNLLREYKEVEKLDGFYKKLELLSYIEKKYKENNEEIDFDKVFLSERNSILLMIEMKNKEWKNKILFNIEDDINSWNAARCRTNRGLYEIIPEYLDKENMKLRNNYMTFLDNRMKELKIDAVIELYTQLSKEEKIICIDKIKIIL